MRTDHEAQMAALGDATRRAILERLLKGPLPVGKLARGFDVSRPAISQHLKVLKDARLVTDAAVGTRRLYAIDPGGVEALRAYLDRMWTQSLTAYQKLVLLGARTSGPRLARSITRPLRRPLHSARAVRISAEASEAHVTTRTERSERRSASGVK